MHDLVPILGEGVDVHRAPSTAGDVSPHGEGDRVVGQHHRHALRTTGDVRVAVDPRTLNRHAIGVSVERPAFHVTASAAVDDLASALCVLYHYVRVEITPAVLGAFAAEILCRQYDAVGASRIPMHHLKADASDPITRFGDVRGERGGIPQEGQRSVPIEHLPESRVVVRPDALRRDAALIVDDRHPADVPAEVGGVCAVGVNNEVVLAPRQRQPRALRATRIHSLLEAGTAADDRSRGRVCTKRLRPGAAVQSRHRAYSGHEANTISTLLQGDGARFLNAYRQLEAVVVSSRRAT